jgi:hypothetical protein
VDWNSKEFKNRLKINSLFVIRMHWDFGKNPIVNGNRNENIETTYSWYDGRIVNFTKEEQKKNFEMYPYAPEYMKQSADYLESLSRAESNINLLQKIPVEFHYINLPKIKSGICMDQFGSLYEFEHKDSFFESAKITHIACSIQSPLHKFDGESFLEENQLRRIPAVIINDRELFEIDSLPLKQKKIFQSLYGEKFYGVKFISYSAYTMWHYYWYQEEMELRKSKIYKRLGI